jgi:deazaflavin-dependent oxidoreductase (nitroreductase family)
VVNLRKRWIGLITNTLNPVTTRLAHSGHGPFSLIRHVGRKTGRVYETPVILARRGDDFVAELTYGPDVAWYRNIVAAGRCTVVYRGVEYPIDGIEPLDAAAGMRAFGYPAELVLRLLRRSHFRLLRQARAADTAPGSPA